MLGLAPRHMELLAVAAIAGDLGRRLQRGAHLQLQRLEPVAAKAGVTRPERRPVPLTPRPLEPVLRLQALVP